MGDHGKCLGYTLKLFAVGTPVAITLLCVYIPALHSMYFVVPSSILSFMVLLYAFPTVSIAMHRRGLMLEDLDDSQDDSELEKRSKHIFRSVFKHILIITTSVAVGVIVDFAVIRFQRDSQLSFLEACGVVGGLLSLLKRVHMIAGNVLLRGIACTMRCMTRSRRESADHIEVADIA